MTLYPQKSVSRNFQSFTAPYKFCLLAPSKRGARRCGKGSLRSPPLWCLRRHLARWEACHWIRGSRGSPMNPVPLPPRNSVGRTKGKRPNGQARRLTSPDLHILCRMCTGDNKAPESEALIMQLYIMHGISSPRSGIYTGTVRPRLHLLNLFIQPSAGLPTFPSPYRFYAAAAWFPAQGMDFLFPPCPA